jgi:hypothetical protein
MNMPFSIQIDPLAGILSTIAILYSLYALYYTRRQERQNACFRLPELWSSEFYNQCRNEGWYEVETLGTPIDMNHLYMTNRILSNQLWTVAHFLEQLHSLHSHKVLDWRLASALFKNNVVRRVDLFGSRKIFWGSEQDFFDKNIKPVKNVL